MSKPEICVFVLTIIKLVNNIIPDNINLALGQPASQSSTYPGYNANRTVDGYNDLCTNTNDQGGGPNWLMIDLQQIINIGYVVVTNRVDCCGKGNDDDYDEDEDDDDDDDDDDADDSR